MLSRKSGVVSLHHLRGNVVLRRKGGVQKRHRSQDCLGHISFHPEPFSSLFLMNFTLVEEKKAGTDNTITGPVSPSARTTPRCPRQAPGDILYPYFVSRPANTAQRSVTAFPS